MRGGGRAAWGGGGGQLHPSLRGWLRVAGVELRWIYCDSFFVFIRVGPERLPHVCVYLRIDPPHGQISPQLLSTISGDEAVLLLLSVNP